VTSSGDLKRENARLRRELESARGRANAARAALAQNRELTELDGLTWTAGIPSVAAQITTASPGNFEETVGLDRGSRAGIVAGNPVVGGDGLVGRVAEASGRRAIVLLLTDPRSGVSVRLEGSGANAVVNGRAGSDLLALEFLQPQDVAVKKGEMVFTSGLEPSRFPPGIPVGKVVSIRKTPGALTQRIQVRPLADVGRLSYVRALQWPAAGSAGLGG
jgi:rod shape-determining protein MreC